LAGYTTWISRNINNKAERKANENKLKQLNNVTFSYYGQLSVLNSLLEPKKSVNLDIAKQIIKRKVKAIKLETVSQLD
jgi:hypothetical protein